MYKRLAKTTIQKSRSSLAEMKIRSKWLFFVEGAITESIYLKGLKSYISESKNIDVEIFDRWKDLSGESNQLKIVKKTKEYLEGCRNISRKQKNKIEDLIILLESNSFTIDDILTKVKELNSFLGVEILSPSEVLFNQLLSIKTCYDYDSDLDNICFVLDRDCGSFTSNQYDEVLEICKEFGYELAISTPNFEFFLLLHLTDLSDTENQVIFENKKSFTYVRLKQILKDDYEISYKKSKYNPSIFFEKLNEFEENILNYSQDNYELKDNIGSSLGNVIKRIINS